MNTKLYAGVAVVLALVGAAFLVPAFATGNSTTTTTETSTQTSSTRSTHTLCLTYPPIDPDKCTTSTVTSTTTATTTTTVNTGITYGAPFMETNFHNGTTVYCQIPLATWGNQTWLNSFPTYIKNQMTGSGEAASSCKVTHIPGTP